MAVFKIIKEPSKLDALDFKSYTYELEKTGKKNMKVLLDLIIIEFHKPFADSREKRTLSSGTMTLEELFFQLADESPLSFKRGIIVPVTVTNVKEDKIFCKLENGLEGIIIEKHDEGQI